MQTTAQLTDAVFGRHFVDTLPADPEVANRPRQVRGAGYTFVTPTAVEAPRLLAWSDDCASLLGLAPPDDPDAVAAVLSGNRLLSGMAPFAACYGGHQFGNWAGQLGDGRAISLGELTDPAGRRWELQLKGAGTTPYSRGADGRAVLRSSLREFLCSEAMHWLGVPTTRALSLTTTGEAVVRDMFYDGNSRPEPGAVVCRVAPSFLRFGNLELPAMRGDLPLLEALGDYVLRELYPEFEGPKPAAHAAWFAEICRRTAVMVAHWMRVGFVHGVMNTDNMSLLGLTIDYGPYGWLEGFEPGWTPNTTDLPGRRYCYGNQPTMAAWNLGQLGRALLPLGVSGAQIEAGLEAYKSTYETTFAGMFADKLGLATLDGEDVLVNELMTLLQRVETDMTLFFRQLAQVPVEVAVEEPGRAPEGEGPLDATVTDTDLIAPLASAFYDNPPPREELVGWLRRYGTRLRLQGVKAVDRQARMNRSNPKYVLRNYLAQEAIDAAEQGDSKPLLRLLHVLQRPYAEQPEHADLAARRPEWARHRAGCSALSCSS